jgi:hypothetical protein
VTAKCSLCDREFVVPPAKEQAFSNRGDRPCFCGRRCALKWYSSFLELDRLDAEGLGPNVRPEVERLLR